MCQGDRKICQGCLQLELRQDAPLVPAARNAPGNAIIVQIQVGEVGEVTILGPSTGQAPSQAIVMQAQQRQLLQVKKPLTPLRNVCSGVLWQIDASVLLLQAWCLLILTPRNTGIIFFAMFYGARQCLTASHAGRSDPRQRLLLPISPHHQAHAQLSAILLRACMSS